MKTTLFAALWIVLTGNSPDSWTVGAVTVLAAVTASLALDPRKTRPWRPWALCHFVGFFLWNSLRGGLDVARRAVHPALPLDPVLVEHPLLLPEGSGRVFLVGTVNLLPGTLSAEISGDVVVIHMLDGSLPAIRELQKLEQRVAALFGIGLDRI
ncbi:hypothetical protein DESUT3_06410 [Desulfuromonas versatilis]|uniref:Cation transporter n=1 Tax=Desulfuromonas versatilis TaxID=2802975 RepID=A0ABM8HRK0_9BACT|nr:Na+/H+ antiporter subunit E [Desulfuromonas versatilis]BCR03572.1 hypothetical protein DESUT3_06410 [Desulfuromonas versatilis]